jgi:acetyltransferase-like isoleucine patch superfamily enzyme
MTKLKEPTTIGELQAPTLDFSLNDLGVFFNVSNNETFPIVLTEFRDLLQENFTLDIPDITDLEEDLQILLDSITNIIEGDITFEGDNIFSGDNITFQNDVTIEGNVHLQDLTNVLINGVSLETILDDYVLDIDLTTTLDDYTLTVDSVNIASWINVNDTDLTLTKATHHNKLIALNMTTQDCVISLDGGEADWSDFQCKFVFLGDEPYKGIY